MIGENAALIVQAEDHVSRSIRELMIAKDRCEELSKRVDSQTYNDLQNIINNIRHNIGEISCLDYKTQFHSLWNR